MAIFFKKREVAPVEATAKVETPVVGTDVEPEKEVSKPKKGKAKKAEKEAEEETPAEEKSEE